MKLQCFFLLLGLSLASHAQQPPYITPLCPQLDNPATYSDSQHKSFGRLIQAPDNWLFKTNNVAPVLNINHQALEMLSQINRLFKQRGTTLVMVPVPHRSLVYPQQVPASLQFDFEPARQQYLAYSDRIRQAGIYVADLTALINSDSPNLFYKRDFHWRPEGARLSAQLVKSYIAKLPVYKQLRKTKFTSSYNGIYGMDGKTQKLFSNICGTGYPREYHKVYQTTLTESDNESLLLGNNDDIPEVVLLGTSFSAYSSQNFFGFLSEQLSVSILNHSVSGGGLVGTLVQYVNSEEFNNNPAKLVIWEYPVRSLKMEQFALVLPKMNNANCNHGAFANSSITLKLGANMVAYNGGDSYRQLKQHQVLYEFQFDNPLVNQFTINTHYVERRQFKNQVGHKRIQGQNGHFVVDQSYKDSVKDLHFLALEVNIENPELVGTKVTTKVCAQESSL